LSGEKNQNITLLNSLHGAAHVFSSKDLNKHKFFCANTPTWQQPTTTYTQK
jgi:hypothetical protein